MHNLNTLYEILKGFSNTAPQQPSDQTFMSKLREIQIEAPEDFSTSFDLNANGDQSAEQDLR